MATYGDFTGIATDGSNLYVCAKQTSNGNQVLIQLGGVTGSTGASGSFVQAWNASSYSFSGICWAGDSDFYICDTSAKQIVYFDGSTFASFTGITGAIAPNDIATDGTDLYVALANATITKINLSTKAQTTLVGSGLSSASYISYGTNVGYLNVSDSAAGKVYEVNKSTGVLTQSISGVTNLRGVDSIDSAPYYFYCTSTAIHVVSVPAPGSPNTGADAGIDGLSGYVDASGSSARFNGLTYVTSISGAGPAPSAFMVDYNNAAIRQIYYTAGPATASTFYGGAGGGGGGAPCFLGGSEILCLVDDKEVYVPVEKLHKGMLVKTSLDGYKKVEAVGKKGLWNTQTPERIQQRLYKLSPANYPELTKDLFLTGCHSILVDELTDIQRQKSIEELERIFVTDRKYRLIACVDERAEPWQSEGAYVVWHFALESENDCINYGVYANGGLLVETCSINFLRNRSSMQII